MNWRDIGKQVAKVAPILGSALGGPIGGAAGALVATALGVDSNPDKVSEAMDSDPEWTFKVMELERKHEESLRRMDLDEKKAEMADTQQARRTHREHWMPWALTCILSIMVSAMVAALIWISIPESNREVIYLIVGQLIGAFSTAISYWLGSSKSSSSKNEQIAGMMRATRA